MLVGLTASPPSASTAASSTDMHPLPAPEHASSGADSDDYLLAKCYLDTQEFLRAAHALSSPVPFNGVSFGTDTSSSASSASKVGIPKRGLSPKEFFVRAYALYMAGERQKEQEAAEMSGGVIQEKHQLVATLVRLPSMRRWVCVYGIVVLVQGLWSGATLRLTGFFPSCWSNSASVARMITIRCTCACLTSCTAVVALMFTDVVLVRHSHGVCLKAKGSKDAARSKFLAAVNMYPLNWSAWLDLGSVCTLEQVGEEARCVWSYWHR